MSVDPHQMAPIDYWLEVPFFDGRDTCAITLHETTPGFILSNAAPIAEKIIQAYRTNLEASRKRLFFLGKGFHLTGWHEIIHNSGTFVTVTARPELTTAPLAWQANGNLLLQQLIL